MKLGTETAQSPRAKARARMVFLIWLFAFTAFCRKDEVICVQDRTIT